MDRKFILKALNAYKFDPTQYVVISSAAMVLYGFKDATKDIDIACSPELFEHIKSTYPTIFERIAEGFECRLTCDAAINFSVHYYDEYKNDFKLIKGFPVQTPKGILALKRHMNRPSDERDIEILQEYLDSTSK